MKKQRLLLLLLLTIAFGALAWWLTFSDSSPFARFIPDPHPATVAYLTGTVERLSDESTEWSTVSIGDTLLPKDQLRTADGASVLLVFGADATVFIGQRSDVRFTEGITLQSGELSYKRMKGTELVPADLTTPDGTLTLGSRLPGDIEEVWISRTNRGTHAAVDRGSAAWTTRNGESRTLLQGDYLQFESVSVMGAPQRITFPEAGEMFTQGYMFRGFTVVWTPDSAATGYRIELSKIDDAGKPYMTWTDTETNAHRVRDLDEGTYSLRVWAFGADGRRSLWSETVGISIGGRFFSALNAPQSWEEPIRFDVSPYRDQLLLGGWLRKDLVETHEIVFYALTDAWWIQPSTDDFRITANEDGYFEAFCNSARSIYVMVVRKGEGEFPESAPRSRFLPFPDGKHILYHIEKPLRP